MLRFNIDFTKPLLLFCDIQRGCRVLLHHFVRVQLVKKLCPLKHPNDHEGDNKSPPPVYILNKINPFDNLLPKSFRSILILPSHPFLHIVHFSKVFRTKFVSNSILSNACYIARQYPRSWTDNSDKSCWEVQITKLHQIRLPSAALLRSQRSTQHPAAKRSSYSLMWETNTDTKPLLQT